jgi:hypothetical protein
MKLGTKILSKIDIIILSFVIIQNTYYSISLKVKYILNPSFMPHYKLHLMYHISFQIPKNYLWISLLDFNLEH